MTRIKFNADKEAETTGGGGGKFTPKQRGIYWLQIMEASDGDVTSDKAKNPGVPITKFRLEVADDDERGQLGAHVYHSVTWIPRGTGEKAAKGHGMAVHWLHATKMPYEGAFDFDEQDFLQEGHAMIRALLEVETYDKLGTDGKTYTNEKFDVREIYTDTNPEPAELPQPPTKRAKAPAGAKPGAQYVKDGAGKLEEEVPF